MRASGSTSPPAARRESLPTRFMASHSHFPCLENEAPEAKKKGPPLLRGPLYGDRSRILRASRKECGPKKANTRSNSRAGPPRAGSLRSSITVTLAPTTDLADRRREQRATVYPWASGGHQRNSSQPSVSAIFTGIFKGYRLVYAIEGGAVTVLPGRVVSRRIHGFIHVRG
ncbi:hypothetical protein GCM10010360_41220 [Streptomyces nogalater]